MTQGWPPAWRRTRRAPRAAVGLYAMEAPDLLIADVREFFRPLR
jgi:hypothetical protein